MDFFIKIIKNVKMNKKIIAIFFIGIFLTSCVSIVSAETLDEKEETTEVMGTFKVMVFRFGRFQNYYTVADVTFQHQTIDYIHYGMDSVNSDYYFVQDVVPGTYRITAQNGALKGSTIQSVRVGQEKEVDLRIGLVHSKSTNILLSRLFKNLDDILIL